MDRMDKGGPFWNRLAAASGIDFVVAGLAIAILAQVKEFENSSDFVSASNEVWGVYALLLGFATSLFLWFTSIFVARLRQVEAATGTSGRLANAVLASGSVIASGFVLSLASQWAARQLGAGDLAELSTALLEGPALDYAIAVYIGAAGLAVLRAGASVAAPSRVVAQLSVLIAPTFLVLGSIQLFNNYAWIDETGLLLFLLWVLAVSVIGVQRWGAIDAGWEPASEPATDAVPPLEPLEETREMRAAERPRAAPKPKTAKRKPAKPKAAKKKAPTRKR